MYTTSLPNKSIVIKKSVVILIAAQLCFVTGVPMSEPRTQDIPRDLEATLENNQRQQAAISNMATTTVMPEAYLDDPLSANPTTTGTTTNSQLRDELCRQKCFDIVTKASKLMAEHQAFKDKEMILVRRKNPNLARSHGIQNRSLGNLGSDQQIIVSRLRVTRMTNDNNQHNQMDDVESKLLSLRTKRDKKQKDACKTLWAVQTCLSDASRNCIGSLAYHTNDVITTQWFEKLRCPNQRSQHIKPFVGLRRTYYDDKTEQVLQPVARPSTSKEDGKKRLDMMFGPRVVLLEPTYNPSSPHPQKPKYSSGSTAAVYGKTTTQSALLLHQFMPIIVIILSLMSLAILLAYYFKLPSDHDHLDMEKR